MGYQLPRRRESMSDRLELRLQTGASGLSSVSAVKLLVNLTVWTKVLTNGPALFGRLCA